MTATAQQSISQTRGDDFLKVATLDQPVSAFVELWFTVRESWADTQTDDTDAVAAAKLSTGGIVATGTSEVTISLPASVTVGWTNTDYVYDLQARTSAGKIYTLVRGVLRVSPDVTRNTAAP